MSGDTKADTQPDNSSNDVHILIIATLPAVLLYFVGWAYLHFYLRAFGVGVSELDLDIETILIYSFPPIRVLLWSWWHWVFLFAVSLLGIVWFLRRFVPRNTKNRAKNLWNRVHSTSPLVQGLAVFLVILFLAILSVPLIGAAADKAANRKWISEGVRIEAVLKTPNTEEETDWHKNYKNCGNRRGLDLIFSDKQSYYMLCISTVDKRSGLVYEVRRDHGLVSVRFITREN